MTNNVTTESATVTLGVDLGRLFYKESIFDSRTKLGNAGFEIVRGSSKGRVTVFGHPSVPGYLFKKYVGDGSPPRRNQLANYERRVRGARNLAAHLEALSIDSIVVPRKLLCKLPRQFSSKGNPDYVVIVEKCNFLDDHKTKQLYRTLSEKTLRELCTIFFTFKHVDFRTSNMPFTLEGKIAFIDTGYLARITEDLDFRKSNYRKNVDKLLTGESQRFAKSLWDEFTRRGDLR